MKGTLNYIDGLDASEYHRKKVEFTVFMHDSTPKWDCHLLLGINCRLTWLVGALACTLPSALDRVFVWLAVSCKSDVWSPWWQAGNAYFALFACAVEYPALSGWLKARYSTRRARLGFYHFIQVPYLPANEMPLITTPRERYFGFVFGILRLCALGRWSRKEVTPLLCKLRLLNRHWHFVVDELLQKRSGYQLFELLVPCGSPYPAIVTVATGLCATIRHELLDLRVLRFQRLRSNFK